MQACLLCSARKPEEAYYAAMEDEDVTEPIFKSTRKAGFEGVNERPAAVPFPSDMGTAPAAGLLL